MMSKVEMLNHESKIDDLERFTQGMNDFESSYRYFLNEKSRLTLSSESSDESIVENFKELFTSYKNIAKVDRSAQHLMGEGQIVNPTDDSLNSSLQ